MAFQVRAAVGGGDDSAPIKAKAEAPIAEPQDINCRNEQRMKK
jgi:hypothetical protein